MLHLRAFSLLDNCVLRCKGFGIVLASSQEHMDHIVDMAAKGVCVCLLPFLIGVLFLRTCRPTKSIKHCWHWWTIFSHHVKLRRFSVKFSSLCGQRCIRLSPLKYVPFLTNWWLIRYATYLCWYWWIACNYLDFLKVMHRFLKTHDKMHSNCKAVWVWCIFISLPPFQQVWGKMLIVCWSKSAYRLIFSKWKMDNGKCL